MVIPRGMPLMKIVVWIHLKQLSYHTQRSRRKHGKTQIIKRFAIYTEENGWHSDEARTV